MKRNGYVKIGLLVILFCLSLLLAFPGLLQAQTPTEKIELALNRLESSPDLIIPGQSNRVLVEVRNYSNIPVSNIGISIGALPGWQISLQTDHLDTLAAGEARIIEIDVLPDQTTDSGYYQVPLIAQAGETGIQYHLALGLQIEGGSPFWLWVGAGIAGLAVVTFLLVYFLYGRQK